MPDTRITVRLGRPERQVLEAAADAAEVPVSAWMRRISLQAAAAAIADRYADRPDRDVERAEVAA